MTIRDKITQGEWEIKDIIPSRLSICTNIQYLTKELHVASLLGNGTTTEVKANALAISKVPEMLELIERIVKYGEQWPIMTQYVTQIDSLVKDAKQLWEELNKQS